MKTLLKWIREFWDPKILSEHQLVTSKEHLTRLRCEIHALQEREKSLLLEIGIYERDIAGHTASIQSTALLGQRIREIEEALRSRPDDSSPGKSL